MTIKQRLTVDDLEAQPDDGHLYELVRGEILRMPPPKGDHFRIEARLVAALDRYLQSRAMAAGWDESQDLDARDRLVGFAGSGEAGVRFSLPDDPDQVRGLDVCYLSVDQVARLEDFLHSDYIPELPMLVAEVISPSEGAAYIDEKVADYLEGGARLVWLLYPKTRTVKVCRKGSAIRVVPPDGLLDGEEILPGFSLPVARLFPTSRPGQ